MRVIDLLDKIANGEEVPKKVKITTGTLKDEFRIWLWDGIWYIYEKDGMDVHICTEQSDLNDEVEVIEEEPRDIEVCGSLFTRSEYNKLAGIKEDKKIERFDHCLGGIMGFDSVENIFETYKDKINEIIDYINKEKEQ